MFRGRSNGGWNKSHGTVEKTPRIDSFGLPASYQAESTGGPLFACRSVVGGKSYYLENVRDI